MPGPNPVAVRVDQERRRSNAAARHDTRPRRQRGRRDAKHAAIRDFR